MPPLPRTPSKGATVNCPPPPADAEEFDSVSRLKLPNERSDFPDSVGEGRRFGDLRTDVHLDANDFDVPHFCGALTDCRGLTERDAEFVLMRSGRDVFVRVRIDIGIDPQRDRSAQLLRAGDFVDVFQLGFALDV